jgi:hypothetical protein
MITRQELEQILANPESYRAELTKIDDRYG